MFIPSPSFFTIEFFLVAVPFFLGTVGTMERKKKNKNLAPKLAPKAKKGFRKQFPESFKSLINGGVGGFRTLARLTTPNDLAKGSRGIYTL